MTYVEIAIHFTTPTNMRTPMKRIVFFAVIGVFTLPIFKLGHELRAAETKPPKPNIIVILADDLGYGDLGCHGCKDIPTPNIDSIAKNGVRATNGYASCSVCSPTRAGLMTGRYQQRFGHEGNPPFKNQPRNAGLPVTEVTLADRLKKEGYVTGVIGKWHLGIHEHFHPQKRGFDEFFGFLDGGHFYINTEKAKEKEKNNPILRGTKKVDEKEYLTDAFGREAAAFIERHKKKPFFLYMPFNAVHSPNEATKKYLDRFPDLKKGRQISAAMLSALDDAVGVILKKVRDAGLEENTIIFFLSDNGGSQTYSASTNTPLRGQKAQLYEGGIRVPFLVQWKGHLPAGTTYDKPVISLDILPTAVALAGGKLPADDKIDGVNLIPYLTSENRGTPHDVLYWREGKNFAIRKGKWKMVRIPDEPVQLFDLDKDIGESKNLADGNADVVKELQADLQKWNAELKKPLWGWGIPGPKPKKE